jgi:hypothetical protein
MRLQELFDRPGEISKTNDEESSVRFDGFVSGDQLVVYMREIDDSVWTVEFRVGGRQDRRGDKAGEELQIFSTVIQAIQEFVQDRQPREIMFTAAKQEFGVDTNRAQLYDRLVRRFANNAGYAYTVSDRDDRSVFRLKRAQQSSGSE